MNKTRDVTIIEVGPRDGLQNEPQFISTSTKIDLINALSDTGLAHIEVTSFVNPQRIPQLADNIDVYKRIRKNPDVIYSALVPNLKGMEAAQSVDIQMISIFTAASETFNQRNISCSIAESLERFAPVVKQAKMHRIPIRAYISCVLGCPYEGEISPVQVLRVAEQLLAMDVQEISFGDTIGVGTPKQTHALLKTIQPHLHHDKICMHFHDTYGQAVANVYAALEYEIRKFDSSLAGLGGCPYARGASGNLATEDLLYLMHGMGLETGVDIYQIVQLGDKICRILQRQNQSKVAKALLAEPR
ncbi:MAG: hydroxymethylglutaryl-CoA lyase [Gammaproteobacteria bacterium]|nr:hydroxymethylglutaryl-CoA lyase [Gammaproteobacteria bacterium]